MQKYKRSLKLKELTKMLEACTPSCSSRETQTWFSLVNAYYLNKVSSRLKAKDNPKWKEFKESLPRLRRKVEQKWAFILRDACGLMKKTKWISTNLNLSSKKSTCRRFTSLTSLRKCVMETCGRRLHWLKNTCKNILWPLEMTNWLRTSLHPIRWCTIASESSV